MLVSEAGSHRDRLPDQAETPAACGRQPGGDAATAFDDMNLAAYFATLAEPNSACANMITPLTVRQYGSLPML